MEPTHRRTFLKVAGATAAFSAFPNILLGAPANNAKLKIGLVGCGGRGTGAAQQALSADENTVLWAIADVFEAMPQRPQILRPYAHLFVAHRYLVCLECHAYGNAAIMLIRWQ